MNVGEGILALYGRFENKGFRVGQIPDDSVREVAALFGVNAPRLQGTRIQLGKRLTAMGGSGGRVTSDGQAMLVWHPTPGDKLPGLYQVQLL